MKKYTVTRLWLHSLTWFIGGTIVIAVVDYLGERWFNVEWPSGADIFPNMILGFPLVLFQLMATGFLIAAGIKLYANHKGIKGAVLGLSLVLLTGICCFFFYILFPYWYQIDLMGRSI